MERKIVLWVVSLTVIGLLLALFLPGGKQADRNPKLPWKIHVDHQGDSQVFGLTLGHSTLNDARQILSNDGKVSLFITRHGKPALEAFFERIYLSGIRGDFVLVLQADPKLLQALYERGRRIGRTTDITRKVELAPEDMERVGRLPIRLINYVPYANLDEQLVLQRFGEPAERLKEPNSSVVHWIYPRVGLDIALNPEGKELLQYVQPGQIDEVVKALKKAGGG